MGQFTDFKKTVQQTELHSRHLIQVEVPVNSFFLNITDTINAGTKMHQHNQKKKTLPQDYRRHLCASSFQIGDDQWPHTDDVGYISHKMRHTQVHSQDGLLWSGARGNPIACLRAFEQIDKEFGHGKTVQTTEHTGNCPLQTPFKQAKIKEWRVN